jgi:hypothetical protein
MARLGHTRLATVVGPDQDRDSLNGSYVVSIFLYRNESWHAG